MALKRMDNVGIVVDGLGGTIDFFRELGLELEGRTTIEGEWAGRVTGLGDQRVEIAMMRTPDGHSRLELSRFLTPSAVADHWLGVHPNSCGPDRQAAGMDVARGLPAVGSMSWNWITWTHHRRAAPEAVSVHKTTD